MIAFDNSWKVGEVGSPERLVAAQLRYPLCPLCDEPIDMADFTREVTLREYSISGMCQCCQHEYFKITEEGYDDE